MRDDNDATPSSPELGVVLSVNDATPSSREPGVVLSVDPGRGKCGLAVVARDGAVRHRAIVPLETLGAAAQEIAAGHHLIAIVLGNGTGCSDAGSRLSGLNLPVPIIRIDERHTSEQARRRFVLEHPARGLQRLVPATMRVPDRDYDDYVAVILAERWWVANPEG